MTEYTGFKCPGLISTGRQHRTCLENRLNKAEAKRPAGTEQKAALRFKSSLYAVPAAQAPPRLHRCGPLHISFPTRHLPVQGRPTLEAPLAQPWTISQSHPRGSAMDLLLQPWCVRFLPVPMMSISRRDFHVLKSHSSQCMMWISPKASFLVLPAGSCSRQNWLIPASPKEDSILADTWFSH